VIRSILLDFDYTLVDSSQGIVHCVSYAFMQMGLSVPTSSTIKATIGHPLPDMYEIITGDNASQQRQAFTAHFFEEQVRSMTGLTQLYTDTPAFLEKAKAGGFSMSIVSTKTSRPIHELLASEGLSDYFTSVIGYEHVEQHKPDPEGVHIALDVLRSKAGEAILIGDSIFDAGAAKNAGTHFIGVTTGVTKASDFDDYPKLAIVPSLSEAMDVIELFNQQALAVLST
jgi:phosphoglycolate phosphatase